MIIPIRCFTCGKVVSQKWDEYSARSNTKNGSELPADVLDDLGITRFCCRRMFISHIDLIDVVSPYQ